MKKIFKLKWRRNVANCGDSKVRVVKGLDGNWPGTSQPRYVWTWWHRGYVSYYKYRTAEEAKEAAEKKILKEALYEQSRVRAVLRSFGVRP